MKRILISAIAILASTLSFAQQPDAQYKLLRYEWTVNADGTSDYHYRHEVQILRNRALVAYAGLGETFVVYNPDLEELTINEVYTLRADGSRVDMPQNAFVYQLPSSCADCGRFNHLRELAMVHTGMELGCTIVVDYTLHRRYNLIYESIPLWRDCPVEQLEVKVNYNNDMDLKYTIDGAQNLNLSSDDITRSSSINTDDMSRVLHYTFKNLQQAPYEPYMPADYTPVLRLYNGTPDFSPSFNEPDFAEAEMAIGKVIDRGSDLGKITNIRDYVVSNIHLNDLKPSLVGYVHSTAAEVWQTGCGTATDKAVLLAAILNHEHFNAHVTGDNMDIVSVMIDTMEYHVDVRSKAPLTLYGEAKDEVSTAKNDNQYTDLDLDTLEDGFFRLVLPAVSGSPNINVRNLALTRTTPLQGSACDLSQTDTYTLPKGLKMVGNTVSKKLDFDGIGSVEISIKQSGKKLKVSRNLKLDKSLVPTTDYANYRQLLVLWQQYDKVLLRAK